MNFAMTVFEEDQNQIILIYSGDRTLILYFT